MCAWINTHCCSTEDVAMRQLQSPCDAGLPYHPRGRPVTQTAKISQAAPSVYYTSWVQYKGSKVSGQARVARRS